MRALGVVTVGLVLLSSACAAPAEATPYPFVVFVGDSIVTLWSQAIDFHEHNWLALVLWGLEPASIEAGFERNVLRLQPDIVFCYCGVHEAGISRNEATFTAAYVHAFASKAETAGVRFIAAVPHPVRESAGAQRIDYLNDLRATFLGNDSLEKADFYSSMVGDKPGVIRDSTLLVDEVHPSDAALREKFTSIAAAAFR